MYLPIDVGQHPTPTTATRGTVFTCVTGQVAHEKSHPIPQASIGLLYKIYTTPPYSLKKKNSFFVLFFFFFFVNCSYLWAQRDG